MDKPAMNRIQDVTTQARRTLPARVLEKFITDDGPNLAIVIAWNALTSIFPIALALTAIGGVVLRLVGFDPSDIYRAVLTIFPQDDQSQREALKAIEGVKERTGLFAIVALAGFLWTASGLFGAMEWAFARVYGTGPRDFARQKLMALAMMGLFTVLAVLAVGSSALVALLDQVPGVPIRLTEGWLARSLQIVVGVVSGFVLFLAIYILVPNRRLSPAQVWPGALLGGIAFELLSLLFPLYIWLNSGINQYGRAFAFLLILLTFFYFLGLIIVLGGELNAVLRPAPAGGGQLSPAHALPHGRSRHPPRGPRRALFGALAAVIGLLAASRRRSRG